MAAMPALSERRACHTLGVNRSTVCYERRRRTSRLRCIEAEEGLIARIFCLIRRFPTYGYRRLWAILRFVEGVKINKKKVYRILREKGWLVNQRISSPRPRVRAISSSHGTSNSRWAVDMTHIPCGSDGWGHLVAVIDCCDREVIGFEFALRGRAHEAERALDAACIKRFGTLRIPGNGLVIRSDNGLVFQSKRFRQTCRDYRLSQEFITPYTPQQNGMIERFFRSLKEECVWLKDFHNFEEAKGAIARWIDWYNDKRPHQALGYLSPRQFREKYAANVA